MSKSARFKDKRSRLARAIDYVYTQVAPVKAAARISARARMGMFSHYVATEGGRLQKARTGMGGPQDEHTKFDRLWTLREYSRDLMRNNTLARGMILTAIDNIIGPGIRPQARTEDDAWNDRAEAYFDEWAETTADVRGVQTFWEMQRTLFQAVWVDGDIGNILADAQLQMIEADRIGTPVNPVRKEDKIINGVAVSKVGKPQAYYVAQTHPTSPYIGAHWRIPARDFALLYRPDRASQTRGVPILAPVIDQFDRLEDLLNAEVLAVQMAACYGLIWKSATPNDMPGVLSSFPNSDNETNAGTGDTERVTQFEPGMMGWAPQNADVFQVKPEHPQTNLTDFIRLLCQFSGRCLGFPLELVLMNFERSNFSNTRAALMEARRSFEGWQQWFISIFLRRAWRYVIADAMRSGALAARDDAWLHDWIPPGWRFLQPKEDAEAHSMLIAGDLETEADYHAISGKDWEAVHRQRERELKSRKRLAELRRDIAESSTPPQADLGARTDADNEADRNAD